MLATYRPVFLYTRAKKKKKKVKVRFASLHGLTFFPCLVTTPSPFALPELAIILTSYAPPWNFLFLSLFLLQPPLDSRDSSNPNLQTLSISKYHYLNQLNKQPNKKSTRPLL